MTTTRYAACYAVLFATSVSRVRAVAVCVVQIGILGTACVDVLGQTAAAEASKAARIIEYITGERPTLYRPPISGDRSPVAMQGVASLGFTITMWSVCPWEWQGTEAQVYER